jgi:hypothetical protein
MKNKAFLAVLLLALPFLSFAQDSRFRLGIRFAPALSTNRITDNNETDNLSFTNNGSGIRFSAGLTGDFYFGKNYSFYTGLWYSVFRSGMAWEGTGASTGFTGENVYNLQYVQVPLALKLFTNEISTDVKLFFILGGTLGVKISEKEKEWSTSIVERAERPQRGKAYSMADLGLLLGTGIEYQMGENTLVFTGINYNRGLLNTSSRKGPAYIDRKDADNFFQNGLGLISLEFGLKF